MACGLGFYLPFHSMELSWIMRIHRTKRTDVKKPDLIEQRLDA